MGSQRGGHDLGTKQGQTAIKPLRKPPGAKRGAVRLCDRGKGGLAQAGSPSLHIPAPTCEGPWKSDSRLSRPPGERSLALNPPSASAPEHLASCSSPRFPFGLGNPVSAPPVNSQSLSPGPKPMGGHDKGAVIWLRDDREKEWVAGLRQLSKGVTES